MGNFFDSKPIRLLAKFVDVVVVNFVFLISCIPIFTIGAALTALYYTCVKSIRMDCGNLLKEYKNSFRMNFKTATAAWIFLAVALSAVGYAAYRMLAYQGGQAYVVLIGLCMALLLFLIAVTIYTFPVLSRFTASWKELLKSAIIMSVKHGGETIYMLVLTLGLGTMIVVGWKFFPVILILMPGIYVLLLSVIMEKVLAIYIVKSDSQDDSAEDTDDSPIFQEEEKRMPWYLEGGNRDE